MAGRTGDPRSIPVRQARVPVRHAPAPAPEPPPSVYATRPAPPWQQVRVRRLNEGLRSGILFDVRSGKLLWARDPAQLMPIASLTKMMTALVVVAHTRPSDRAMITRAAVHFSGSGVGELPLGKRVPVLSLL